ncbi:hypothetical protein BDN70DRAFT_31238 [Pholiota conissans]|uniref:Uncharacterized protein n=1 Tax=Pholiota conissans TaxID=109636 RepID=A0A9P5Z2P4_9AGAR|nr:hypothetical protein BDN70DRAFT_31238 [Pholiota conissans]
MPPPPPPLLTPLARHCWGPIRWAAPGGVRALATSAREGGNRDCGGCCCSARSILAGSACPLRFSVLCNAPPPSPAYYTDTCVINQSFYGRFSLFAMPSIVLSLR